MQRSFSVFITSFLWLLSFTVANAAEPNDFFFKSGDRVLFLGDSITEQYQYSSTIELYLTTRFPKWNLTFLNAGISGDTASGGASRFARDILAEKPTAVTINFGMNDGGYGAFDKAKNQGYVANTEKMLGLAKQAGLRVAVVSPNAVDRRVAERFKLYLETQKEFYAPLAELAARHGMTFVDQYAITRAALERMEAADPQAKTAKPFGDGFHTSPPGGLLMAHAILTGLQAPALVSEVSLDAKTAQATAAACAVSNVKASETSASFERLDEALPLPVQKDWLSVLPYMSDLRDLNWCGLKVASLSSGNYELAIDGQQVGTFTDVQLAQGVNLGNLTSGPIFEQANKVFQAINAKNTLVHQRFRGVVMFQPNFPDWLSDVAAIAKERRETELAKRLDLIREREVEIKKLSQPVKHQFELKRV